MTFPRKGAPFVSVTSTINDTEQERWRLREAIGKYGTFVIIAGAITIPIFLGLLIALWGGQHGGSGESASQIWRTIVLNGWVTEAVTLLSMGMQVCANLQSLICTSLAAATILETAGVPVSQLAEMSMMRGVNDGPWRLVYLTLTSSWRRIWSFQPLLVLLLYIGTLATQFGSTILVTDLELTTIMGQHNQTTFNSTIPARTLAFRHLPASWAMPPKYYSFAEIPSGVDPTPSPQGLSDTGNLRRMFQPFESENATRIRQFEGPAYGWNSRVVCMPPVLDGKFRALNSSMPGLSFILQMTGQISYEKTFENAGIDVPALCNDQKCLPPTFNCSLPTARAEGARGLGLCALNLTNALVENSTVWLNDGRAAPVNPHSMAFLISRNGGTLTQWGNLTSQPVIPTNSVRDGEWAQWNLGSGFDFGVTMCFMSSLWELSRVRLSSARDTVAASPQISQAGTVFDTRSVVKQLGVTKQPYSLAERSLYTVDSINDTRTHTNETFKLDVIPYHLLGGLQRFPAGDFTMFVGVQGFGGLTISPFQDYNGVFEDVLLESGRPGLALQSMFMLKLQNAYYALVPSLINPVPVTVTESVRALAPVRWTGLLIFVGIILVHFASVITITATFLLRTRYSKQGHFWHTISQVITEDTIPLLQHASESRDDHAMARSCLGSGGGGGGGGGAADDLDPVVVVARSTTTGHVQIIRRDELGRA